MRPEAVRSLAQRHLELPPQSDAAGELPEAGTPTTRRAEVGAVRESEPGAPTSEPCAIRGQVDGRARAMPCHFVGGYLEDWFPLERS